MARPTTQQRWSQHTHLSHSLMARSCRRFWHSVWRETTLFEWYSVTVTWFRRFRLFRLLLGLIHALLLALQAGTLALLLLPLLLIVLPILLILSLTMLLGGWIDLRMHQKRLARQMMGRRVIFLSASPAVLMQENSFFAGQLRELSRLPNTLTVVRTPFLLSMRGFGGHGWFWTVRRELPRLYLARSLGYFRLRRVATESATRVIVCY